jgi:CheY-like chemotaxis protein
VRCAADGLAALVEINQEIPEILLSDLNMPGMSGFELLPLARIIREDRSEGVSGDMASPRRLLSA